MMCVRVRLESSRPSLALTTSPRLTRFLSLAVLRPLPFSPSAQGIALLNDSTAACPFPPKRACLPETIRHRLSALPGEQRMH